MKKWILFICLPLVVISCKPEEKNKKDDEFVPPEKEEVVKYYPDGKLRTKGMLYDGERHGKWTYYYENGILWSEGKFYYGERDGYSNLFYKSGKKMVSGQYKNNKVVGTWYFYDENGELKNTINADEDPAEVEQQLKELAQVIAG